MLKEGSLGKDDVLFESREEVFLLLLCGFCRPLTLLQAQIPAIVKAIHKQLREKSFKTRQVNVYLVALKNSSSCLSEMKGLITC